MIDPKASKETKLKEGRDLWEQALDHYEESNKERRTAALFYHNSKGHGQWDRHDREFLEEEGRPVLSFNVCKNKLDAIQGMLEDVRMTPVAKPVGREDVFLAEVNSKILERVREQTRMEDVEWKVFSHGLIRGDGILALDVAPDPSDPVRYKFTAKRVPPHEVMWDTASEEPDRGDAGWVVWHRWYKLAEFKQEFPDHADRAEEYLAGMMQDGEAGPSTFDHDTPAESSAHFRSDRDYDDERWTDYYDRKRRQIRVIHLEYQYPHKRVFLTDGVRGISKEIKPSLTPIVKEMQERGELVGLELITVFDQQVHWLDFIRDEILFDAVSPQPFDGYSLVPFTCFLDDTDNTTYGCMRNLLDPQREVNKARSQKLELNISQSKPGYIAEKSAIPNLDTFERQNNSGASVAIVEDGALTGGQIQERKPGTIAEAARERGDDAMAMVDRIGGIGTDLEHQSANPEALGTVQLRYRRAQIAMREIFKHAEQFQVQVSCKILQAVTRSYPDFQLQEILGDSNRYMIQEGQVVELVPGEDGGPQPGRVAPIRDLRRRGMDIDLEATTGNNTLKLMDLQQLAQLATMGQPVDPTVMIEKAVSSRGDRERLLAYVEQQQKAQAAGAQQESEQLMAQLTAGLALQTKELAEKARHNVADEAIKARGQEFDLVEAFAKLLEPAASDEFERTLLESTRAQIEARRYERGSNGQASRGRRGGAGSRT